MVRGESVRYTFYLRASFVVLLLAVTWFLLRDSAEVNPVPIKKALSNFPHVIGPYRLSDSFQSSSDVVELLGVDQYLQYNYISSAGDTVNFYVGYYHSVGVDGSYHSPQNCIPGGGWGIDEVSFVPLAVGIEGESTSTVSEMIIRRGGEYQVVLYWYQNRGRIIASEYWEKIYLVWDALVQKRRDGAFIRIMTTAKDGDLAAAKKRCRDFAELTMTELSCYLPGATL